MVSLVPLSIVLDDRVANNRSSDAYWVGEALSDDGVLSSDHRPVFCDLTLSHTLVP